MRVTSVVHYAITAFLLLGWLARSGGWLRLHALACAAVVLHWLTNGNRCALSEHDGLDESEYTQGLARRVGLDLSPAAANALGYVAVLAAMAASLRSQYFLES